MKGLAAGLAALVVGFACDAMAAELPNGLARFSSETPLRAALAEDAARRGQTSLPECPTDWEVCPGAEEVETIIVTGSSIRTLAPSITNNQVGGVDEGDIVKISGDVLVILRRGRLFTVTTADGDLRPVDWIDATPPGISPEDYSWFDEMLVADGWVAVIGYSYERDGTDIIRFRINGRGDLTYVDSHRLASNDYYSSRNYASRLIGDQLIVYSPQYVERDEDPFDLLPTLARMHGVGETQIRPLLRPEEIHIAPDLAPGRTPRMDTIHTVTRCDLTARVFACRATAILGPEGRSFYVAPEAVYLWITHYEWPVGDSLPASMVYRIPLDGAQPQAARTRGAPVDQFSFLEDPDSGMLHVLVVSEGGGDAMWRPEFADGRAALLSLPLSRFSDGRADVEDGDYRLLPPGPDNGRFLQNLFVGRHLLYTDSFWTWRADRTEASASLLTIVPLSGEIVTTHLLDSWVERIEQMGRDALVVTRGDDVTFHTVALEPDQPDQRRTRLPRIVDSYVMPGTRGAETRSHAFFYRPDADSLDGEFGVLGLPVVREYPEGGELIDEAADLAFLRRGNNLVRLLGTLDSRPELQRDDRCVVSCFSWYGDARPIFVGDRIFALLGYELVEGRQEGRTIREIRRVNFASVLPIR